MSNTNSNRPVGEVTMDKADQRREPNLSIRIQDAILDPRWEVSSVGFDDSTFLVFTLFHPLYGRIDALLPIAEARSLGSLLLHASADIIGKRLSEERRNRA